VTNITFAKAINEAHRVVMRENKNVFVFGEDVAQYGGVYKVTEGLLSEFGRNRVRDTPISEAAIAGAGVGAALIGTKPIIEIGFIDFAGTCFDQIVNQAAKYRYLSGGRAGVPLVIRMTSGTVGLGYGVHHSQSTEAWFTHVPGLKVVTPSNPADAKGLFIAAVDDPDPVIFLEHKHLYQMKGDVPEGRHLVPIGRAAVCREGTDLTVVAWSQAVNWALTAAAEVWASDNISVEVIDLRSLVPLDQDTVFESVKKTGRVITCHEACRTGGFGGEISARIIENVFDWLDAPPGRVTAPDMPVPSCVPLEKIYLSPRDQLADKIREICGVNIAAQ
jgi:acetoin:2,6-dichlorophenolindophenol oxidoreductase subunit beta